MYAPAHPIGQLTTSELAAYRRALEHAARTLKEAPVGEELQRRLDEVTAEEESRVRAREGISAIDVAARQEHYSA